MEITTLLYVLIGVVVSYFVLLIGAGIWKGWSAVKTIWGWTKKIGWLVLVIGGGVILFLSVGRKNKDKANVEERLSELRALETKTEANLKEIQRLEEEKKKIEESINATNENYRRKIEELRRKPDEPKPGDAGRSSDELTDTWK